MLKGQKITDRDTKNWKISNRKIEDRKIEGRKLKQEITKYRMKIAKTVWKTEKWKMKNSKNKKPNIKYLMRKSLERWNINFTLAKKLNYKNITSNPQN